MEVDVKVLGKRAVTLAADFNSDGNIDLYTSGCQDNSVDIDNPLKCSTGMFYEYLGMFDSKRTKTMD